MTKFAPYSNALVLALAAAALSAATGLAFAGWMEHGAGMFASLAASGLAWCF
jgi:hypothetical protein